MSINGQIRVISNVTNWPLLCLLVFTGLPIVAAAQDPGSAARPQIMKLHDQAEEVFQRGDYERAMFIYRNELVPIGDKYGQYMVGFMFLAGKGVQQDIVEASAWYRLAAERGTKEFVQLADQLLKAMTPAQRELSDSAYLSLREQFSDATLLLQSARADYDFLNEATRPSSSDIGITVLLLDSRDGARKDSGNFRDVEKAMKSKLRRVAKEIGIKESSIDYDDPDWQTLETQVSNFLLNLN